MLLIIFYFSHLNISCFTVFTQLTAMLDGEISVEIIISIVISIATIGFTVAQISYDFDTDPLKRAQKPNFYGFVPDSEGRRIILFIDMTLMSSVMLIMRAMGMVILGLININYVIIFLGADMGVFLLLKIARRDLNYWVPIHGLTGIGSSFLIRIILKIVTDFTGILDFRHPYELGGLSWSLTRSALTRKQPVVRELPHSFCLKR